MNRPNQQFKPTKRGLEGVNDRAARLFYEAFAHLKLTPDAELTTDADGHLIRAGETPTRFWSTCSENLHITPAAGFTWVTRAQAAAGIEAATKDVIAAIKQTLIFNNLDPDEVTLEILNGGVKQHVMTLGQSMAITVWADVGAAGVSQYPPEFQKAPETPQEAQENSAVLQVDLAELSAETGA